MKSNKEIIDEISKIVEPYMEFYMDDIYGEDRGCIPYPEIESLDILYFKFDSKKYLIDKNREKEIIEKINLLDIGLSSIEICKSNYFERFLIIKLNKYNKKIINQYNNYLDYKNKNCEKINEIYQYLEEKIPEEFVGWVLYSEK